MIVDLGMECTIGKRVLWCMAELVDMAPLCGPSITLLCGQKTRKIYRAFLLD